MPKGTPFAPEEEHREGQTGQLGKDRPLAAAQAGDPEGYSHYDTRVEKKPGGVPARVKPAGRYLAARHAGRFATVWETCRNMLGQGERRRPALTGPFYEDVLLDELSVRGYDNYVRQPSIRMEEKI